MSQITVNKNVNIELTPQELTLVLSWIGEAPHKQVEQLITNIRKQVLDQITPKTE